MALIEFIQAREDLKLSPRDLLKYAGHIADEAAIDELEQISGDYVADLLADMK
jgi:hypothetical protein